MLTNRYNLPSGVVSAIENDPYHPGDSDITVTALIAPAFQRRLLKTVHPVEDASDRIWSLLGSAVHSVLERAYQGSGMVEQRLYTECEGWRIGGQFDVIEDRILYDYKVTSTWSVLNSEVKPEWEKQLNLLRLLAHRNGIEIDSLKIIAILRDWSAVRSQQGGGYPPNQVAVVDVPVWDLDRVEAYMNERVRAHQDPSPPICSDEERWKRPNVFAVMKDGRKTAVKLHDSLSDAERHADELGDKHHVEVRQGAYVRCETYCTVMHDCPAMRTPF